MRTWTSLVLVLLLVAGPLVPAPRAGSKATADLPGSSPVPVTKAQASVSASVSIRLGVPVIVHRPAGRNLQRRPTAGRSGTRRRAFTPPKASPTLAPATTPPARPTPPNAALSGAQGLASYYDAGPGIYGAMPGFVDGTNVRVRVCSTAGCLDVQIVTQCQCYVGTRDAKIIDLSPAAFRQLAPLSVGVVRVTVARLP